MALGIVKFLIFSTVFFKFFLSLLENYRSNSEILRSIETTDCVNLFCSAAIPEFFSQTSDLLKSQMLDLLTVFWKVFDFSWKLPYQLFN